MSLKRQINRQFTNITRYSIAYEIDHLLVLLRFKKKESMRSIHKKLEFFKKLPEEQYPKYLAHWYKDVTGRTLHLDDPVRFTEKIQWMKLYDQDPMKTVLADKYLVRDWIKENIGEEFLIPLYGVWDTFDEIDFEKLPESFVLKCNHGSKMNLFVKDKNSIDRNELKKQIDMWMSIDFAHINEAFELQYNGIQRKILAEKYMKDKDKADLDDYKFYCFDGKPIYCQVIGDRSSQETIDFFDMDWKRQDFIGLNPIAIHATHDINKPVNFQLMKEIAEKLSTNYKFVRVDFYEINGKLYFGEMTFTPQSGAGSFKPDFMDYQMGSLIHL